MKIIAVTSIVLLGLLANDCDATRIANDSYAEDVAFEDEYLAQIESEKFGGRGRRSGDGSSTSLFGDFGTQSAVAADMATELSAEIIDLCSGEDDTITAGELATCLGEAPTWVLNLLMRVMERLEDEQT